MVGRGIPQRLPQRGEGGAHTASSLTAHIGPNSGVCWQADSQADWAVHAVDYRSAVKRNQCPSPLVSDAAGEAGQK